MSVMRPSPKFLALFLIGLFLAFSFNAYACVVTVYPATPVTSGSDCTKPGKEPVTQFCDGFKTLAVQSVADFSSFNLSHVVFAENSFYPFLTPATTGPFLPTIASESLSPPRDIHILISVFRI
ncbi:MAG: hypothetical protein R3B74_01795 [Nitrospirales bacterium]|nr:hypothetical protein [Nitrospirales bacterium]